MKPCRSLVFLLLCMAIVTTAPADAQDEKAAVTEMFKGYARAWDSLDAAHILPYYHEPLVLVATAGVRTLVTRADIETWVKGIFTRVTQSGYARAQYSQLNVKQMASGVAMASGVYVRYKADGQELERLGTTYIFTRLVTGGRLPSW